MENEISLDRVDHMSSMIDNYGVSIVLISVFLVLFIAIVGIAISLLVKFFNKNTKMTEDLLKKVMEKQDKQINENIEHKNKSKKMVNSFIKINDAIKSSLIRISDMVESDSISLFVFHNGKYSSHGLPFYKTSCISQYVKPQSGLTPTINYFQNINLALIDDSIEAIYRFGKIIVNDIKTIETQYPILYNYLTIDDNKFEDVIGISLYDSNNCMVGIVIVKYVNKNEYKDLEQFSHILQTESKSITPVLEYSNSN